MSKIFNNFSIFKSKVALISENYNVSYYDLINQSEKIKKNIKSKTISLIIAQNNPNFIIGYVAFLRKKKNYKHINRRDIR